MADDVKQFIHKQNMDQCVLIGHSMYETTHPFDQQLCL